MPKFFSGLGVILKAAEKVAKKRSDIKKKLIGEKLFQARNKLVNPKVKKFLQAKRKALISLDKSSKMHVLFNNTSKGKGGIWPAKTMVIPQTSKAKQIERMQLKASLVEEIVKTENYMLKHKSNFQRYDPTEDKYSLFHVKNYLETHTQEQLTVIEKEMNHELSVMGIKSSWQFAKAISSEEYRMEKIINLAYRDFMENWKNGFFAYSPEMLGMSEDERRLIWNQIQNEKTPTWWREKYADFLNKW